MACDYETLMLVYMARDSDLQQIKHMLLLILVASPKPLDLSLNLLFSFNVSVFSASHPNSRLISTPFVCIEQTYDAPPIAMACDNSYHVVIKNPAPKGWATRRIRKRTRRLQECQMIEISQEAYEKLEKLIGSDDSPVGIDAKKTHILILHKLMEIERRLDELRA